MSVVQGLPINEAHILSWILFMLFSDFKAQEPGSIPTPPMTTMIEFLADAKTNIYPLPVSWYFISSSLFHHDSI